MMFDLGRASDDNGDYAIWACVDGTPFYIDIADVPLINPYRWRVHRGPAKNYGRYIARSKGVPGGTVLLHRSLLDVPRGLDTDHIDGNKFNNRRYNLRICTHTQNCYRKHHFRRTSSGFRGVYATDCGRWEALISIENRQRYLGTFDSAEEAARAFDAAALRVRGEFALLNYDANA